MKTKLISILLTTLILSSCSLINRAVPSPSPATPSAYIFETATDAPTQTPIPTSTVTPTPTADLSQLGLPPEGSGTTALDFVANVCSAQWFNEGQNLPCPGDDSQSNAGYVLGLNGVVQGLPSNTTLILTYPPQVTYSTIFSKYPPFTVEKGDRFRAVLACKLHTFCDVEFALEYFDIHGKTGFARWNYRFSHAPLVIDYPMDGIAGKTVQFGLSVRGNGNRTEAYAVWIDPHIYRPVH